MQKILVNGKSFLVRRNLYEFLEAAGTSFPRLAIWIDAICIDQFNHAEKNQQVRQMGKIYTAAENVVVWLGNDKFWKNLSST